MATVITSPCPFRGGHLAEAAELAARLLASGDEIFAQVRRERVLKHDFLAWKEDLLAWKELVAAWAARACAHIEASRELTNVGLSEIGVADICEDAAACLRLQGDEDGAWNDRLRCDRMRALLGEDEDPAAYPSPSEERMRLGWVPRGGVRPPLSVAPALGPTVSAMVLGLEIAQHASLRSMIRDIPEAVCCGGAAVRAWEQLSETAHAAGAAGLDARGVPAEVIAHVLSFLRTPRLRLEEGDIDIFVVAPDRAGAERALCRLLARGVQIGRESVWSKGVQVCRTPNSWSLGLLSETGPDGERREGTVVQIITIWARSLAETLAFFDMDICAAAVWGDGRFEAHPRFYAAAAASVNTVDPLSMVRWSTPRRLGKYFARGYGCRIEKSAHRSDADAEIDEQVVRAVVARELFWPTQIAEMYVCDRTIHNGDAYGYSWTDERVEYRLRKTAPPDSEPEVSEEVRTAMVRTMTQKIPRPLRALEPLSNAVISCRAQLVPTGKDYNIGWGRARRLWDGPRQRGLRSEAKQQRQGLVLALLLGLEGGVRSKREDLARGVNGNEFFPRCKSCGRRFVPDPRKGPWQARCRQCG